MSERAPLYPTDEEKAAATFRWEYDTYMVDVTELGDPPDSRRPLIVQRRRLVGGWETYRGEPDE
jgi:hypothetical protein